MRKNKVILLIVLCLMVTVPLASCSKNGKDSSSESNSSTVVTATENRLEGFSTEDYIKKVSSELKPIQSCKNDYEAQVKKLAENTSSKIDFSNCEFKPIDKINSINLLGLTKRTKPSEDEVVEEFEKILKRYNLDNVLDIKRELRDASNQFPRIENPDDYPYFYPSVFENRGKFTDGGWGFFIDTHEFYLAYGINGYYSFSDGVMVDYSQSEKLAGPDAYGVWSGDIVDSGPYSSMKDKTYKLLNGEVKVCDAAEMVKDYFMKGTPYSPEEGITVDIPYVIVFKMRDICGYEFKLRRIYNDVPFAYADTGNRHFYQPLQLDEDIKAAFTITGDSVNAFCGYNEAQPIVKLTEDVDQMIDVKTAAEILEQKIARELNVRIDTVEFCYLPVQMSDTDDSVGRYVCPCWGFFGEVINDGKGIRLYIDALTGELYYYTFRKPDSWDGFKQ